MKLVFTIKVVNLGPVYMEVGGLKVGGVTRLCIQSLILVWSRLHYGWGDHMRVYMDKQVTTPKQVT